MRKNLLILSEQVLDLTLDKINRDLDWIFNSGSQKVLFISMRKILYAVSIIIITGIFVSAFNSCSETIQGNAELLPPQTYLTLFPDSIISPGSTTRKISWWGDSPNGFIEGFRISFDSINWGYTTRTDSTFVFTISGQDSTFRIWVAAVDNNGMVDPTPASNLYPVVNSSPTVIFDPSTNIPDSTFPVATFKWIGTDPDGDNTIKRYWWSLNDTINWRSVPGTINLMTLTVDSGLVLNSNNILYLRAEDNAGSYSGIARMPDTNAHWYVKENKSRVLLIKDVPLSEGNAALEFFSQAMDTVDFDVLDIKVNNGSLIPKIINPMFIETLKLYDVVIWSANRGGTGSDANFDLANSSLPFYHQAGGKVFFTTGFPTSVNQTQGNFIDFAPIDSISQCIRPFVLSGTSLINVDQGYPVLTNQSPVISVRALYVQPNVPVIYNLPVSATCQVDQVCIKNSIANPNIVFMSVPVYFFNSDMNASKEFF